MSALSLPQRVKAPIQYPEMAMLQNNTLIPIYPTFYPQILVLGAIFGATDGLYWDTWSKYPLLFKIIDKESRWNPNACNTCKGTKWEGLFPPETCACGLGLGQLIPTTIKRCKTEILKRDFDPTDGADNFECSLWLYLNEGTGHWGNSTTDWGSYKDWSR